MNIRTTLGRFVVFCAGLLLAFAAHAQSLSATQITALRAACFLDVTCAAFISGANPVGLRGYMNGGSGTAVWRTDAPVTALLDAINWSLYTPSGSVDDGTLGTQLTALQRGTQFLAIQTKQINLQLMLQGRTTLDCRPSTLRAGLRDATIQVPSGAGGALTSPGGASGVNILAGCQRTGTRAELMLAAALQGSDTTGSTTGRVMTWEGQVSENESNRLVFKDDGTLWTP